MMGCVCLGSKVEPRLVLGNFCSKRCKEVLREGQSRAGRSTEHLALWLGGVWLRSRPVWMDFEEQLSGEKLRGAPGEET